MCGDGMFGEPPRLSPANKNGNYIAVNKTSVVHPYYSNGNYNLFSNLATSIYRKKNQNNMTTFFLQNYGFYFLLSHDWLLNLESCAIVNSLKSMFLTLLLRKNT